MRVLFVSAEVAPLAKVGGLADVAGALPMALSEEGVDVRIVMPDYAMIENAGLYEITTLIPEFDVQINEHWSKKASLRSLVFNGVTTYLIGTDEWFIDADRSETIYRPGIDQYLFFSKAVLQLPELLNWNPDVIHCHDWQTGFIPVLMNEDHPEKWHETSSVYTIHNLAYQGEFDFEVIEKLGLSPHIFNANQVEAWGRVNFLKAGAAYSDMVTTVSENYAQEVQTPEFGNGLDGLMRHLNDLGKLWGILNGIDQDTFNPSNDPDLYTHFTSNQLEGKSTCKQKLLEECGLPYTKGVPLLGVVSRISSQKGLDLILEASEKMFELPVQLVILGAGEPQLVEGLRRLEEMHPQNFKFIEGFHLSLAPRIYSGCDGFLMPSAFEPCGLGQMIAMRYGTVPVVRSTGGLADTVFEGQNGFTFPNRSADELLEAVKRFTKAFESPARFWSIQKLGMETDFSWTSGAKKYIEVYEAALESRRQSSERTA